jgi:hypothetical protein
LWTIVATAPKISPLAMVGGADVRLSGELFAGTERGAWPDRLFRMALTSPRVLVPVKFLLV